MGTAWVVPRALVGDEFLEATFPEPLPVSGIVIRLRRPLFRWPFKRRRRQVTSIAASVNPR